MGNIEHTQIYGIEADQEGRVLLSTPRNAEVAKVVEALQNQRRKMASNDVQIGQVRLLLEDYAGVERDIL